MLQEATLSAEDVRKIVREEIERAFKKDPAAKRYESLSYREVMVSELGVMDQTAVTLCKENNLPLIVLNIHTEGAVASAVRGERVGTIVR